MKTWEMIKELTENPYKEFVRHDGLAVRINKYMELIWESGYSHLRIDDEWEEVKNPVDFMTAVKSGKKVRVEHHELHSGLDYMTKSFNDIGDVVYYISERFGSVGVRVVFLEGKWYIED